MVTNCLIYSAIRQTLKISFYFEVFGQQDIFSTVENTWSSCKNHMTKITWRGWTFERRQTNLARCPSVFFRGLKRIEKKPTMVERFGFAISLKIPSDGDSDGWCNTVLMAVSQLSPSPTSLSSFLFSSASS